MSPFVQPLFSVWVTLNVAFPDAAFPTLEALESQGPRSVHTPSLSILNESGCIQYDLHQDNDNPTVFLFYENWESREKWQQHMNNSHLTQYLKVTEDAVASFTLNEMTQV